MEPQNIHQKLFVRKDELDGVGPVDNKPSIN